MPVVSISLIVGALLAVPGLRLALQWWRTRQLPEGLLTVFFLGFALGVPIRLLSVMGGSSGSARSSALSAVALTLLCLSMTAFTVFVARVFRPGAMLAVVASGSAVLVLYGGAGYLIVTGRASDQTHPVTAGAACVAIAVFWWAFAECFAQYRRMARQRALGFGDAVVCNRFALWSLWTGGVAMLPTASSAVRIGIMLDHAAGGAGGAPPAVLHALLLVVAVSVAVAAVALWLSFFPPTWYVERLTSRGAEATEAR